MSLRTCTLLGSVALMTIGWMGCTVGPDHQPPGAEIQDEYRLTEDPNVIQGGQELAQWWYQFDDPTMNALMDEAIAQNLDLEIAALRVMESRYQRGIVRSNFFPQFDADGSYIFQKTAIAGGIFGQLGGFAIDSTIDNWDMGFNASWELDVFGRLRRDVEASNADIGASVWNYRDSMIILMADVASNYVDARAFQYRLEIANRNLASQKESLELLRIRVQTGADPDLSVVQAETTVYNTESTIPTLEIGYQQSVNRLSVLLGHPPGFVDEMLTQTAPIPSANYEVAIGIPADLLRRRPDIRRAERELAAQTARVGVAVADLYPQLSLNGTFGVNAQDFSQLYSTNSISSTIGPTVRWNLFNFGRVRSNIAVQEVRAEQFYLQYQNSVLRAAEEVDNSLVSYVQEKRRVMSLRSAVASAAREVELARVAHVEGKDNFLPVLVAERALLQLEDQLAVSEANVSKNLVQLYRTLGGGWEWVYGECLDGLTLSAVDAEFGAMSPSESLPIDQDGNVMTDMPIDAADLPMSNTVQGELGNPMTLDPAIPNQFNPNLDGPSDQTISPSPYSTLSVPQFGHEVSGTQNPGPPAHNHAMANTPIEANGQSAPAGVQTPTQRSAFGRPIAGAREFRPINDGSYQAEIPEPPQQSQYVPTEARQSQPTFVGPR